MNPMTSRLLEQGMYDLGQLFLMPVLLALLLLFFYAFVSLGRFVRQAWGRRRGWPDAFELLSLARQQPGLGLERLEAEAVHRLERVRIATRIAPMLGLTATMIPMGPALRSLADGQLNEVSRSLTLAFSAVILSLIASSITYALAHVRRRWYGMDLLAVAQERQP